MPAEVATDVGEVAIYALIFYSQRNRSIDALNELL